MAIRAESQPGLEGNEPSDMADRREVECVPSPTQPLPYRVLPSEHGKIRLEMENGCPPPAWLAQSAERMNELLQLPRGWNSHKARPTEPRAATAALELLGRIMIPGLTPPQIVPTVHGGVQLEWHVRGLDVEIEVAPDGLFTASLDDTRVGNEIHVPVTADPASLLELVTRLAAA